LSARERRVCWLSSILLIGAHASPRPLNLRVGCLWSTSCLDLAPSTFVFSLEILRRVEVSGILAPLCLLPSFGDIDALNGSRLSPVESHRESRIGPTEVSGFCSNDARPARYDAGAQIPRDYPLFFAFRGRDVHPRVGSRRRLGSAAATRQKGSSTSRASCASN